MGLLHPADWQAGWIAPRRVDGGETGVPPAPLLRRRLTLDKPVASARVYVSGLGYYELSINGRKVGDEVLAPAFTRYDHAAMYQTHDVTAHLQSRGGGENVLGVVLGNGWYNASTEVVWDFQHAPWRDQPKLLLQLHIRFTDGTETVIITDPQWRCSTGPTTFDALRNGQHYDARLEKPGWDRPDYDDSEWMAAKLVPGPGGILRSQQMTPIRVTATLKPVALQQVRSGVWVFDIGQNLSGWAQLSVSGAAGTIITLKYAEKTKEDGDIDQSNIDGFIKSGECQTDRYTLKGDGAELWEPQFTYHGFQYVQMTGFAGGAGGAGTPTLDSLRARVVHTAFEPAGAFECSNELLNKIQRAARWSTVSNYHGIPTDCPHREKNGWTGDASLSAEQVLFNFDAATAYRKWMADFRDMQRPSGQLPGIVPTGGWSFNWGSGPAWDSAAILIPWYLYLYRGDVAGLEEHYDCMRRYVDYVGTMATGHIVDFGLGDWCPPDMSKGPGGHACPTALTDTAYYFVDATILAQAAALLGKMEDAERYQRLAAEIRAAFRGRFPIASGDFGENDQTSLACVLYQGLVDPDEQARVLAALVAAVEKKDRHIDCGILGTKYVMQALTDGDRADLAYSIATQTTFPSWGHWIAQGATTLWETWDGSSSRNHHMFSDVSAWFYKALAGINPDPTAPGFKNVIIRPNPVGDLRWVKAWHRGPFGMIECNWTREGAQFALDLTIPANSTALVLLPTRDPETIRVNGEPVAPSVGQSDIHAGAFRRGRMELSISSGNYHLTTDL
jgi:alpha-L-rhamnosidase